MYIQLTLDDQKLVQKITNLLALGAIEDCKLEQLALFFTIQSNCCDRRSSFNAVLHSFGEEFEHKPARSLKSLKSTIHNMTHRVVELEDGSAVLLTRFSKQRDKLPFVGMISKASDARFAGESQYNASVFETAQVNAFVAGIEDAATHKIAGILLHAVDEAADIDELTGDADLPTLIRVTQHLWKARQNGNISAAQYEQLGSSLLRISGRHLLGASAAFAIPGIGPAISSLIFARRIERL